MPVPNRCWVPAKINLYVGPYLCIYYVCTAYCRHLSIMGGKSVCLSAPLAPSLLHGRGPQPWCSSPWALGTCPLPAPTGSLRGGGRVVWSSFPADSAKFVNSLSFVATSGEWWPLNGPVFWLPRPPPSPLPPRPSLGPQSRSWIS